MSYLMPIGCHDFRGDFNVYCGFDQKINVRLSGLCEKSPIDLNYALLEAKMDENEGNHWHDYYRYGTFSGKYDDVFDIHDHYVPQIVGLK